MADNTIANAIKFLKGEEKSLPATKTEGQVYFAYKNVGTAEKPSYTGAIYIDTPIGGTQNRIKMTANADIADKALNDSAGLSIRETYLSSLGYTDDGKQTILIKGSGNNQTRIALPIASTIKSGIVTTDAQSFGGTKTFTTVNSTNLTVTGFNGFNYSGIGAGIADVARPVWFADSSGNGKPVINTNFTYNPATQTLSVANLSGTADKANKDNAGNDIRSTYISNITINNNIMTITKGSGATSTLSIKDKLYSSATMATKEDLDKFIEANVFKFGHINAIEGYNGLEKNDGIILSGAWNSSANYGHQIYIDDSGYALRHRYRNSGIWSDWASILDSTNYNSYAPTKTGGGASGTWGINISGNAASANKLNTNAGSATFPVYFSNGVPVACSTNLAVNAASATKLTSNAGSVIQPIYFKDGKPVPTTYSLNATVNGAGVGLAARLAYYSGDNVISSTPNFVYKDNKLYFGDAKGGGYLNGSATNGGCNSIMIGDDAWLGDVNQGGIIGIKSTNESNVGFWFYNSSTTNIGKLYINADRHLMVGNSIIPLITNSYALGNSTNYWSSVSSQWLHVNRYCSDVDGGITLYGGSDAYCIAFRQTSSWDVHGYVTGDWATYFTMSNSKSRGWIFKVSGSNNVASIDTEGNTCLNGYLKVKNTAIFDGLVVNTTGIHTDGNGKYNYCKIMTLKITTPYMNRPITIEVGGRGRYNSRVTIMFTNSDSIDPNLQSFTTDWENCYYIKKVSTSTWEVYTSYSESYGSCVVNRVYGEGYYYGGNGINVAWNMENISALPEGTIQASYAGNVSYSLNADMLDGYHGSSNQAAKTYVLRDEAGYIYTNYINSNTSNNENPSISQIIVTNGSDNFYRKASLSHLKSSLGPMPASDVYAWAKASTKPSYSWGEITGKPSTFTPSSHDHTYLVGSYTENGGQQNPNYFGLNKVGFLMMNTTVNGNSSYKDWLIMDCYGGNDVGGGVAFGVNRQRLGAYIMRSDASRKAWAEGAELLHTANYTEYTVTKSGSGASGTWGINVTGSAGSVAWGNISGKPSSFTPASHTHPYLPLSGGTMTGTINLTATKLACNFRPNSSAYCTGIMHQTNGNEALVFAAANAVTSFIFKCGQDPIGMTSSTWTGITPSMQIKKQSVYINSLIANNVTPAYNLYVNGTTRCNGTLGVGNGSNAQIDFFSNSSSTIGARIKAYNDRIEFVFS